jgi:hypothetical protein
MNAVLAASYLAVYGLVQIAQTDYRTLTAQIYKGHDSKDKWIKVKNAFKTAISEPYHYLY